MRRRPLATAALGAAVTSLVLLPASGASATTTLGFTGAGNAVCAAGVEAFAASGPDVATSSGVITALASNAGNTSGDVRLLVVNTSRVVTGVTPQLTFGASGAVSSSGLRIPIAAGDALGFYSASGFACYATSSDSLYGTTGIASAPTVGSSVSGLPGPTSAGTLTVSATVEPDADRDGYGDETQDACPTIPQLHTAPCTLDVGLTAAAVDRTVGVRELDLVTATISNPSGAEVQNATISFTPPPGIQLVSSSAPCTLTGTAESCAVGSLRGTSTATVLLGIRVTTAGAHTLMMVAASDVADSNSSNNVASITVTAVPHTVARCVVPKLVGLTKANAVKALKAKGCAPGAVTATTLKSKHGKVVAQAKKPGTKLPYGTKVGFRVAV